MLTHHILFAQICNIELSRGIPRLCCHHVKEQWCQPIGKKNNNLIYIYIDRCICKKYAAWCCEAENKQQRSHVTTQIWIQGCPQDAAKVSIVFSCPLHPSADIWRQSSTNVGTRLKKKKKKAKLLTKQHLLDVCGRGQVCQWSRC